MSTVVGCALMIISGVLFTGQAATKTRAVLRLLAALALAVVGGMMTQRGMVR